MKPIHAALAAVTIAATLATGTAALSEPNDLPSWQHGENRIGNRVFNDLNGNGIADPDEPGIANVTVILDKDYAEAGANEPNWVTIASGASSDGGWWSYDHLNDGCYRIGVIPPDGAHPTWETPTLQQWFDHDNNDIDPLTNHSRRFCLDATTRNDSHYRWKIGLTLPTDHAYTQIAAGVLQTCGVQTDRRVACWGTNVVFPFPEVPAVIPGITNATSVTAGLQHACAVLTDGTVKCWGKNDRGELGDDTTSPSATPVAVKRLGGVKALSAGSSHTCALLINATVRCWGLNEYGQLGDGELGEETQPVQVAGVTNAIAVSAGYSHTCAVLADGTVRCWGRGDFGQLGDGERALRTRTPVPVTNMTTAIGVAVGYSHTCAVLADGTVRCWGRGDRGELGYPDNGPTTPVQATGVTNAVGVSAGEAFTCALLGDGTAKCWGTNGYGQLGGASLQPGPFTVFGLTGGASISTGVNHTCVLLADGTVTCWGKADSGQLGDGYTFADRPVPVSRAIRAGYPPI